MTEPILVKRKFWVGGLLEVVFLVFAGSGLALNLFLLSSRFAGGGAGIAGCGGGGCGEVLASRWSMLFGVPVTAFGLAVYGGLLASVAPRLRLIRLPLLGVVVGAALWFVLVQAVILKSFCPWCMAAHGVGLAMVVLGLSVRTSRCGKIAAFWAAASFLGIGLAQVFGPVPASHRIEPADVGRVAAFDDGRRIYQVDTLPRLGPADATHVLVEYFDYQCAACRTMAGFLEALVSKHPGNIAVLVLPMPLDGRCNTFVAAGNEHPGSCDAARIALAVWRVKPEAFADFHRALIMQPSPESARRLALEIMSEERLAAALADPWIEDRIRAHIADWHAFSNTTDKLPKLLIRDRRILHGLPSGEKDFIRVMEEELGL